MTLSYHLFRSILLHTHVLLSAKFCLRCSLLVTKRYLWVFVLPRHWISIRYAIGVLSWLDHWNALGHTIWHNNYYQRLTQVSIVSKRDYNLMYMRLSIFYSLLSQWNDNSNWCIMTAFAMNVATLMKMHSALVVGCSISWLIMYKGG